MTTQRNEGRWSPDEHARFLEGLALYPKSPSKHAEHIRTRDVTQVNNYKQAHKKRQEKAAAAAAAAAETTASAVQPATPPRPRATDAPPAAPPSEETLRPPPSATREDQDGVEEFKEETPAETSAAPAREETPHEEDHDVEVRQDAPSVVTSDTAQSSQSEDSVTFVLAVMNTKDSGNVRKPAANPGITQTAAYLFPSVMTCFKLYTMNEFGSVPAAWLLSEVPWVLGGGNMSSLSQCAPDGASSRLETKNRPDAAVVWGAKYAEGSEALRLVRLSDRGTGEHYVEVQRGENIIDRVDLQHLDESDRDLYDQMLVRVAAARLTLAPDGQCLVLSYHGPSSQGKLDKKCRFLGWLLQLARSLANLLKIPVVVGGDFNLDVSKLEVRKELGDAAKGAELVKYKVNQRREDKNVLDWLYLINPRDGFTCLVCERCEAIDPAQPFRDYFAAEENFTLHENFFDHDALLARLRLKASLKFKFWSSFNYQHQYHHWVPSSLCCPCATVES